MNTKLSKLVLAMGALMMAGGVMAADTSTMMTTSAVVPAACVISNATTIALGSMAMLDASQTDHNTVEDSSNTGTFDATCTNGTTGALFSYSSANESLSTITGFTMTTGDKGASETMVYSLYPSTLTTGDPLIEDDPTAHGSFTADGTMNTLALAVKIPASEKIAKKIGSYTDTVTINVTFGAAG